MNKTGFTGNITRDVELKQTASGISVCDFTVAIRRPHVRDKTDFINFRAWRAVAEFICRNFKKGDAIEVWGFLTTETYESKCKNCGAVRKVPQWVVEVDEVNFPITRKAAPTQERTDAAQIATPEFTSIPDDSDLPF